MVLPQPFGPMMPIRSPRMMRAEKSAMMGAAPKSNLTCRASNTSLPDGAASWTLKSTCPMRSRRSLRSRRSCLRARTRPSLRVRRASTPWRIHASSCASFLSNSAACFASTSSAARFSQHVVIVVAGPLPQLSAIEFDDARRKTAHEGAVVADEQQSAFEVDHHVLEPGDRLDIEMVRGLIQQQQVRRRDERPAEHHAPAPAAGQCAQRCVAIELQARDDLIHLQVALPLALRSALADALLDHGEHRVIARSRHLLREARHPDAGADPHLAAIGNDLTGDQPAGARIFLRRFARAGRPARPCGSAGRCDPAGA